MKTIVRSTFGSHLYGTNTETSDTDRKAVHLPNPVRMLLHEKQEVIHSNTKEDPNVKNAADDIDDESFALHKFFHMLESGDTMAIEMMFTPGDQLIEVTPEWRTILAYRDRFVINNAAGPLGYIMRQAAKYGVKGSRMATVQNALKWIESWIRIYGSTSPLSPHFKAMGDFARDEEHSAIVSTPGPTGLPQFHWEVVGRKLPFGISLGEAHKILTRIFENYGERTRAAASNNGVDWKALSHAMRVGTQTIELLETGEITFPRPDAKTLLRIKRGDLTYERVAEMIERIVETLRLSAETSTLPKTIDRTLADQMILHFYSSQIFHTDPVLLGWSPPKPDDLLGRSAFQMMEAA